MPSPHKAVIIVFLALITLELVVSCANFNSGSRQASTVIQAAPQVMPAAPVAVAPSPAPVIVNQQPSNDGFVTGMLMGHLMSGGGRTDVVHHYSTPAPAAPPAPAPARNTTIINQNVKITPTAPSRYQAPAASRSSSSPASRSSSSFGSFRPSSGRR